MSGRRELETTGRKDPGTRALERRVASLTRGHADRLTSLEGLPLAGAKLLRGLALTTTPQRIQHGLGKRWTGAIVTRADAAASLILSSTSNDAVFIGVAVTDGAPTVDVLVF